MGCEIVVGPPIVMRVASATIFVHSNSTDLASDRTSYYFYVVYTILSGTPIAPGDLADNLVQLGRFSRAKWVR